MTSLEDFVVKKFFTMYLLAVSFLAGQSIIQVKLKNGKTIDGEFIGTYMEHIHLLTGENINYFKCDDVQSVTEPGFINVFEYDCSKNTVTADILFPPELNPMTGEWETVIPDVFDPKKRKALTKKEEKPQENSTKKNGSRAEKVLKRLPEKTKNKFEETIISKIKPAISDAFYEKDNEEPYQNKTEINQKVFSSPSTTNSVSKPQKEIKERLITHYYEDGTINISEDEIRRFIKKEVRKELRKALPYEIKKHKEQRQNKIFQNILLGCGAWFLFMIMLS